MYKVLVPCVELRKNTTHPSEDFIIASTGKVALKKEGTATLKKSGQTLNIPYAEQTYALTDTSTKIYPIRLARNTPEGDFSFWMHPSIYNNTPAKQLLRQAVEQWRCASGVNFTVVCDTTTTNIPVTSGDHQSTISMINHDAISFAAPHKWLKCHYHKKI